MFYALHKKGNHIIDIYTLEKDGEQEAKIFTRFFNHVTISYWTLVLMVMIEMIYI